MSETAATVTSAPRAGRSVSGLRGRVGPARLIERIIEAGLAASALLSIATTVGIVFVLGWESIAFFREVSPTQFLFDTQWTPLFARPRFGIWPLVAGTLLTTSIAIAVALPLGLLAAVQMSEFSSPRARAILKPLVELLAGIPTVVFGYFALVVVTPLLQKLLPGLAGFNALAPGLLMGIMITPTIASLSEDAIGAVPRAIREAAWGVGASETSTILRVVVPSARSGIAAATLLAISRAIGETMIVAIAAGQQPRLTLDPRVPIETMTAFIVQVAMGDVPVGTMEYRTLFVVGASLFVMTLAMNVASIRIARGVRRRSRGGA